MEFNSCFDIIGPIMVGPSSSHTAGVVSIGKFVYDFLEGAPDKADIVFYDSFAATYKGHGTDKAIVGGLMGMGTDDLRIRHSLEVALERNIDITFRFKEQCPFYDHPNTVFVFAERGRNTVMIGGASLGGGLSKIFKVNEFSVDILLNSPYDLTLLRKHTWNKAYYAAEARGEEVWISNQ